MNYCYSYRTNNQIRTVNCDNQLKIYVNLVLNNGI